MDNFSWGQDPVFPGHFLGVEPVQPPVTDIVFDRITSILQFKLQRSVGDPRVFLGQIQLEFVAKEQS